MDRNITFTPTDTDVSITFNVSDDSILFESTENLLLTLELITPMDRASISPFNTSSVVINDDDGMSFCVVSLYRNNVLRR